MSENKTYWLISVPKAKPTNSSEDIFNELDRTTKEKDLSRNNAKFNIPELRVGNIDSLISLSDVLKKVNTSLEQTIRKLATQFFELQKDQDKNAKKKAIDIRGHDAEEVVTKFKWDDARYPKKKSLPELTQIIKTQMMTVEKELREKSQEYNSVVQKLAAAAQNESGNLQTRDLTKDLAKYTPVESDYLTTLFVVVPKADLKNWMKNYESLTEYVVPRSSEVIVEDGEYQLVSVVLFKTIAEKFKNEARSRFRFTVRKNDPTSTMTEQEKESLKEKRGKLRSNFERWASTQYAEIFLSWLHLKCIQCYVESILRFGLPAEFQAMVILPKKGAEKKT